MKPWQEKAKEYLNLSKGGLGDQYYLQELKRELEFINTATLSQSEFNLLKQVFV